MVTTLTAIFRAQDKLSSALAKAGTQGSKTTGILRKLGSVGSKAVKGIVTAIGAAGTALIGLGKKALDVGMNFESSMSQVMATMGKNTGTAEGRAAYEQLSAAAEQMGAETAFSASQAAEALNYLALAGYDVEQATAALPTVLHLAGAGGMELATASDMITDSMAALQMEVNQTNLDTFADQMAKTASTTNTSVSQLGEAILTVGATAANLKNGTTELNTQLGILANVGIKGSEGGTHLRNILLRLQSPTDKAAKQLKALGVSVYDAQGNMRDTGDIFLDLKDAMKGMDQSKIDQIMASIFNKTDLAAANALLAASGDEYSRIFEIIENSGGAAKAMYETMLDNLTGDVDIFRSAVEAMYIAMFKGASGLARELVQTATSYINRLTDAFKKGGFAGMAGELGNVLGDAIGQLTSYLPKLVGLATEVIASLVDSLGDNADKIFDAVADIGIELAKGVIKIAPKLGKAAVKVVGGAAKALVGAIPKIFQNIPDSLYRALGLNKQIVTSRLRFFATFVKNAFDKLLGGDLGGALKSLGTAFGIDTGVLDRVGAAFTGVAAAVRSAWDWITKTGAAIRDAFATGFESGGLLGGLASAFGALRDALGEIDWAELGSSLWEKVKGGFTATGDWIKERVLGESYTPDATWGDVGSAIWSAIKGGISATGDWLKEQLGYTPSNSWLTVGKGVWEKIKTGIKPAGDWLKEKLNYSPSESWSTIGGDIWDKIVSGIKDTGGKLKAKVTELLGKLPGIISELAGDTANFVSSGQFAALGETVIGFISAGIQSHTGGGAARILEAIRSLFDGIDFSAMAANVSAAVSGIGDFMVKMLTEGIKAAATGASMLVGAIGDLIGTLLSPENIKASGALFSSIGTTVINLLGQGLSAAGQGVTILAGAIADLIGSIDWSSVMETLGTVALSLITALGEAIGTVDFAGIAESIGKLLGTAIGNIPAATLGLASAVTKWFLSGDVFAAIGNVALALGMSFIKGLGGVFEGLFGDALNGLAKDVSLDVDWQARLGEIDIAPAGDETRFNSVLSDYVQGIAAGLNTGDITLDDMPLYIDELTPYLEGAGFDLSGVDLSQVNALISDMFSSAFGEPIVIDSESVKAELGDMGIDLDATDIAIDASAAGTAGGAEVADAINTGIQASEPTITTQIQTSVDSAVAAAAIDATSAGENVMSTLAGGISGSSGLVTAACTSVGSGILSRFRGISLYAVGRNLMVGLNNGMQGMTGTLLATAGIIAAALKAKIQGALDVHSPSRFTDWVGRMLGEGLAGGLEATASLASAAAEDMAGGVRGALSPSSLPSPSGGFGEGGASVEKRIVVEIQGGGRFEISGMNREQAMNFLAENLMPAVKQALADEIYEGGDDVYEF